MHWLLQVDASKVCIAATWQPFLQAAISGAAASLGVEGGASNVSAHLYKLLLYEQGGHFEAHRDTEKEPGMFATLVVQLPCQGGHRGGQLRVSHQGSKMQVDFEQVTPHAAACSLLLWCLLC